MKGYFIAVRALLIGLITGALQGCYQLDEEQVGKTAAPNEPIPLTQYTGETILDMYEGSRRSWVLKTQNMVKWPNIDLVDAKPIDLVVLDSLEEEVLWVQSDSGAVDEKVSFLSARGNVYLRSAKGVEVRTDSLRWNQQSDQISTEAYVVVKTEGGDTLAGDGLVSDAKLNHWQILSNVSGVFQRAEERIEQWDDQPGESETDTTGESRENLP